MTNKNGTPRRPDASVVFTDREQPREAFSQFFERLYKRNVRGESGGEAPLLNFYGVGGVGKTTLLIQAAKEFRDRFGDETDFASVHLAHLDLHGLQLGASLPMVNLLWRLRNALVHYMLHTPLFDCVYRILWESDNPGRKLDFPKDPVWRVVDKAIEATDTVAKYLNLPFDSSGLVKRVWQFWQKEKVEAGRSRYVGEQWGDIHPREWSQQQRFERLSELLRMDIVNSLESQPLLRISLLVDEFERIQTTVPKAGDAQTALSALLRALLTSDSDAVRQRFCVVIMGREKLRWENPDWQPLIESHILGGLSEKDAREFLIGKVATWYDKKGNDRISNAIVVHQDEILSVTSSASDGGELSHLPFHLDLVLEVINANPEEFSAELLANEPEHKRELEDRFLRYLKGHNDRLLKALQSLALCYSFDRPLFDYLLSEQVIVGFAPSEFMEMVGEDHSYVEANPNLPGSYLFHRQMQLALINSQLNTNEVRAGTRERLCKILEYFIQAAQSDTPFLLNDSNVQGYCCGFEALKGEAAKVLLPTETISEYALRLVRGIDLQAHPRLLQPFFEWLYGLCQKELGVEHPDTLASMNSLAITLLELGDYSKAKALFEKVLALNESSLGMECQDTFMSMTNLAMALLALGDSAGARGFLEKALQWNERNLGAEHEDTLMCMNNLAISLLALGDSSRARSLFEKVLPLSERIHGAEDQHTIRVMNNLACSLAELGDVAGARELEAKVLALRERVLGAEHPDTLSSMHNQAVSLRDQGDLQAARKQLEMLLPLKERIQGGEHPETLKTMNGLAMTLWDLRDLPSARELFEKLVLLGERVLGAEHPDTFTSQHALAGILRDQGDLPRAREIYEKVALLRERVLGEHRDTLASIDKLANTCRDLGDWQGAQKWFEKVMLLSECLLGVEDKETLRSMNDLALALTECGDLSGAQQLLHKALPISDRVMGRTHPATITMMENQRGVLHAQGDFAGAQRLNAKVSEAKKHNQGRNRRSKR